MNQYEIVNAGHRVDGYFLPRPGEDEATTFERAKAEAIENFRRYLEQIEALTLQQFKSAGFQSR